MKKIGFLLATIIMAVFFVVSASAATECGYTYEVANGEATITKASYWLGSKATIPDTLGGYPVTAIGDYAFYNELESVTIGKNVKTIGDSLFSNYRNLAEIKVNSNNPYFSSEKGVLFNKNKTELIRYPMNKEQATYKIPDSVTKIAAGAFQSAKIYESIEITDSVTEIGERAFRWCDITEITIPGSVTTIGEEAFYYCDNLTSVTIENGVKTIGTDAFGGCGDLYYIIIPDSVTSVVGKAFYWNTVIYCNENSYIASYAAENGINYVIIDDTEETVTGTVESITWTINKNTGLLEFSGSGDMPDFSYNNVPWSEYRYYITSVKLAEGITKIGAYTFYRFYRIKNIVIPDGVTTIGSYAFYDCESLTSIIIPDGVTTIGERAFSDCRSLTSVTIPASVTTIGDEAFDYCENLRKVNITDLAAWCAIDFESDSATPFANFNNDLCLSGVNLYLNNELVKDLIIPDGVTTIKSYAFLGCGFSTVTIPESVINIGLGAFALCSNIKSITVDENNQYYSNDEFGVLFNKDKTELIQFPMQSPITIENIDSITTEEFIDIYNNGTIEYTIPDTVKVICDGAFLGCFLLKKVNLPEGLTTIGDRVFGANGSLMIHLYIPGSVTKFGNNGAYLLNVELGEGITSIDDSNYGFLSNAWNIMIPESVTEIKSNFFSNYMYGNLVDIFYAGTQEQWNSIELSDSDKEYLEDVTIHFNSKCNSHKYNSEIIEGSNCEGVWILQYTCENCGWYYFEYCFDYDVLHTMSEWTDFIPATCTSTGLEVRYCILGCGHYETRESKKDDHTYSKVVTAPTCQAQGYTTYTCSACGYSYVGDYVGGKTHNYTSTITRPATHLSEGIRTYTCGTCGESYTEAIAKLKEHNYNTASKVVAPSCEKEGYTVYVCECGQSENRDKKAAKGHNYDGFVCADCGETKADNCSCNCHKKGIANFFWKIGNFFNKLFKIKSKQTCACGIAHY